MHWERFFRIFQGAFQAQRSFDAIGKYFADLGSIFKKQISNKIQIFYLKKKWNHEKQKNQLMYCTCFWKYLKNIKIPSKRKKIQSNTNNRAFVFVIKYFFKEKYLYLTFIKNIQNIYIWITTLLWHLVTQTFHI